MLWLCFSVVVVAFVVFCCFFIVSCCFILALVTLFCSSRSLNTAILSISTSCLPTYLNICLPTYLPAYHDAFCLPVCIILLLLLLLFCLPACIILLLFSFLPACLLACAPTSLPACQSCYYCSLNSASQKSNGSKQDGCRSQPIAE